MDQIISNNYYTPVVLIVNNLCELDILQINNMNVIKHVSLCKRKSDSYNALSKRILFVVSFIV